MEKQKEGTDVDKSEATTACTYTFRSKVAREKKKGANLNPEIDQNIITGD